MDFSKERLLASGFTAKELQKLQNNIDNFGGTFELVVRDLSKRFYILIFILSFFWLSFIAASFFSSYDRLISYAIGLLIMTVMIAFIQPPVISYKCWRFCRRQDS
ncbi:hypothetical protein [Ewingella americana]|uniref:hypothetical protein n=1 Tax=Ewingella americana TaxID=41202 RepID=UPI0012AE0A04|nr:hypothetical protein [Ewingella americana]MRT05832.1 hypothetical protein [Ewingella americana]